MRMRWGVGVLALLAAGCGSPGGGAIPGGTGFVQFGNAVPAMRGKVTMYQDTYGDPAPAGIVAGPDRALWFTDPGNDVIGRITKRGKYTLEMRAGTEVSVGITVGPDRNLWFTLQQTDGGIGRITPKGVVTLFADPGGSYTQGITVGPDRALWFAESNGTVGRMTMKGRVTHFTVAPSNAELEGIVTGPDGNLWVTQYVVGGSRFSNQVIRITPKGKSTSYTVGSGPANICVGLDQALWFTEEDANAIGRITTSGKVKQYSINYKYATPFGIAKGPDGALWFTDASGRAGIGRMTVRGKVTFYRVPGSFPALQQITTGPDGAMWFTSSFGPAAIGRITTH